MTPNVVFLQKPTHHISIRGLTTLDAIIFQSEPVHSGYHPLHSAINNLLTGVLQRRLPAQEQHETAQEHSQELARAILHVSRHRDYYSARIRRL